MAGNKLSTMDETGAITGAERIEVLQGGQNKAMTLSNAPHKVPVLNSSGYLPVSLLDPYLQTAINTHGSRLDDLEAIDSDARLDALEAAQAGSMIGFTTKALMDADLAHGAGVLARVTNDDVDPANNGVYIKLGATGAGSWQKSDDEVSLLAGEVAQLGADVEDVEAATEGLEQGQSPGGWIVVDAQGRVAARILPDGTMRAARLSVVALVPESLEPLFAGAQVIGGQAARNNPIVDGDGRIASYVAPDGTTVLAALEARLGNVGHLNVEQLSIGGVEVGADPVYRPRLQYSYAHVFSYGQSLSLGTRSTPVQSTVQRFDSLSFVGGARPLDSMTSPAAYASFVPLVENTGGPNTSAEYGGIDSPGETPLSGMFEAVKELLLAEDSVGTTDVDYKLVGTCSGKGATAIAELSKGNLHYNRLLDEVAYAKVIADAASRSYGVPAVIWLQGEGDVSTVTSYRGRMNRLAADLNADIKAVTGQTEDVLLLSYQTPSQFAVAVEQWKAALDTPNIHIAAPIYQLSFADSIAHLDGPGSKLAGAYFGKAYKRLIVDGFAWKPLSPLSISAAGKAIYLHLHVPAGKVTIDTSLVGAVSQYGFVILNSSAGNVPITAVELVSRDTIRLVTNSTITAGFSLRYGTTLDGGNIRDEDGEQVVFDEFGLNYPLHNWLIAFELTL